MSILAIAGSIKPSSGGDPTDIQVASGTTADGSAGLTVPFGAAVVSGAGTSAANGTYTFSGNYINGRPYFNISGTTGDISSVFWNGAQWRISSSGGATLYNSTDDVALPWLATFAVASGSGPAPTVACSAPVTAGDTVLAFVSYAGVGGITLTLFSDPAAEVVNGTAFVGLVYQWFADGSAHTGITLTANDAVRSNLTIIEVSGLANTAPIDTDTNSGTGSLASLTGLTGTGACYAIFAVENATNPFVGLASNVNVTGIGAGDYTCRGEVDSGDGLFPYYNLVGQPTSTVNWKLGEIGDGTWSITNGGGDDLIISDNTAALPWQASWTGSVVTESPSDWTLVTIPPVGGSNVWQCVAWKVGAATPVSLELTTSLAWASAGVVFEAA